MTPFATETEGEVIWDHSPVTADGAQRVAQRGVDVAAGKGPPHGAVVVEDQPAAVRLQLVSEFFSIGTQGLGSTRMVVWVLLFRGDDAKNRLTEFSTKELREIAAPGWALSTWSRHDHDLAPVVIGMDYEPATAAITDLLLIASPTKSFSLTYFKNAVFSSGN